ncbi:cache domain-containing sensor histidine kinase [Marinicrinis sediminis]|uniref:Sensor histidine kinase n=1 Tax=Marinicrinis sediminis TaxID=1652465 RepID=A0ABW5RD09_9BACL
MNRKIWKRRFRQLPFRRKLFLTYMLVSMIPAIAACVIFGFNTYKQTKEQYYDFAETLNQQTLQSINTLLDEVDRVALMHVIDSEIADILNKPYVQTGMEYVSDLRKVESAIDHAVRLNPKISGVTFVGRNDQIYSNAGSERNSFERIQKWAPLAMLQDEGKFITSVYEDDFNQNPTQLLSVVYVLGDWQSSLTPIGYANIDISYDSLQTILGVRNWKRPGVHTLVLDDQGLIYQSRKEGDWQPSELEQLQQQVMETADVQEGRLSFEKEEGSEVLVYVERHQETGWHIVQYVPRSVYVSSFQQSLKSFLVVLLLTWGGVLLLATIFSMQITKPIQRIRLAMRKAEEGRLEPIEDLRPGNPEFQQLMNSYNKMIEQLNESIEKEYRAVLQQKKAELKMLQLEINPHFLYNALNNISSLGEIHDIPQIQTLSDSLSQMFRYNLRSGDRVTVREELQHVQHYLLVQQVRFIHLQVSVELDESIAEMPMRKFLIQPIVENALSHGLEPLGGKGKIEVRAKRDEHTICFTIRDNGAGMSAARQEQLRQWFREGHPSDHLGLANIYLRLQHDYGEAASLSIRSLPQVGTVVQMRIPIQEVIT